jgi:Spy/CpxP family protein refolding chaperone
MKKIFGFLLISTFMVGLVSIGLAVGKSEKKSDETKMERMKKNHERRIQMLTERLNLTDEQKVKIEDIFNKREKKREQMKDEREKGKNMKDETDAEIEKVLTSEQKEKYRKMKKERGHGLSSDRHSGFSPKGPSDRRLNSLPK